MRPPSSAIRSLFPGRDQGEDRQASSGISARSSRLRVLSVELRPFPGHPDHDQAPARGAGGAREDPLRRGTLTYNLSPRELLEAFVNGAFPRGIQMQFMGSFDAGYNWDRPDFPRVDPLGQLPEAREKIFRRIFHVNRPGAGLGLAAAAAAPTLEISFPESEFRPRFVWQSAAQRRRHRCGRPGAGSASSGRGDGSRTGPAGRTEGSRPRAVARDDGPGLRGRFEAAPLRPEGVGSGRRPRPCGGAGFRRGPSPATRRPEVLRRRQEIRR